MRQDIERLNATINNVLNAAMYTDRPVADPQPLDLARLARRAVELTRTRHQLAEDGDPLRRAAEPARGAATPQALETAVLNLLDNAVKYSKDRVEIEVEVWGDGDGQAHAARARPRHRHEPHAPAVHLQPLLPHRRRRCGAAAPARASGSSSCERS